VDIPVAVATTDSGLRKALLALVKSWPGLRAVESIDDGFRGVVIGTPRDCSLQRCEQLTRLGNSVVILAPIWREHELTAYETVGAFGYLPMDLDLPRLSAVVSSAAAAVRHRQDRRTLPVTPIAFDR
jgi:hypothetical protein